MKKYTFLKLITSIVICVNLPCALNASYNIKTIAGTNATSGFSGDEAIATSAKLSSPIGVCRDSFGNLYIADTGNHRIQMVFNAFPTGASTLFGSSSYTSGYIYTIAGSAIGTPTTSTGTTPVPGANLGDGGPATSATLFSPNGICVDGSGNLYIADTSNDVIRMVFNAFPTGASTLFGNTYTSGYIYTIAGGRLGNGRLNPSYSGDSGIATSARLRTPSGVCLDSYGNLYIADTGNNVIRMISNNSGSIGNIYTVVGSNPNTGAAASPGYAGDGGLAGASSVQFNGPRGICFDSLYNLYIADSTNTVIRMVCNTAGTYFGASRTQDYIYTIAGTGPNASDRFSLLNSPSGVCLDSSGNLYIASTGNHSISIVNTSGSVSLLAGSTTGAPGPLGDGGAAINTATVSGNGILHSPKGICVDTASPLNVYVADTGNHAIRELVSTTTYSGGTISTAQAAITAYITGGGTTTLSGTNTFGNVEIDNGVVSVASAASLGNSSPAVTFNATSGSATLDITATMNTGALTFTTAGTVQVDGTGVTATLSAVPTGSGTLSKTGTGILAVSSDMHTSSTPMTVANGRLQVGSSGALPTAATSIASGAILELVAPTSGTVPGATTISAGGTLQLDSGTVASNALSNVAFNSGSILCLNGCNLQANITVG